jgi:hypothetical protein
MLIVMTAVAVAVVVFEALGSDFAIALANALLVFGTAVCCVAAAVYARGNCQAFFIGAACLACLAAIGRQPRANSWFELAFLALNQSISLAIAGGLGVATRRFVEHRGWHLSPRDGDSWIDD